VHVNYCYACENAEGFRLFVDGKLLVQSDSKTTGERGQVVDAPVHFADTKPHDLRLEYLHGTGSAGIDLTWLAPADALRKEAVEAAKDADVVVAFVGLSPSLEGEEMPVKLEGFAGGDRTAITLPTAQEDLLKALSATGKPLVVVLQNGSSLAVNWAQDHAQAILEAWYPGEEGGDAIADTLSGANNPAGRLPLTFYRSLDQLPAFDDYAMKQRTYRYFTGKPLYPFGYGLSYTTFTFSHAALSTPTLKAGDTLTATADVTNSGAVAGDEVAELYLTPPHNGVSPNLALAGFERVHLAPGETRHLTFTLNARTLSQVDAEGVRTIAPGRYTLTLGETQPTPTTPTLTFQITGTQQLAP
jgi:beta-glucosidase